MVDINPGLTIWTWIIFAILFILLGKTVWKPMLASLRNREQAIADSLSKAEQARADAERMIAENKLERVKAEEEIQKSLREGREYAERMRQDLVKKAHDESQRMLEQARGEIQRDTQAALITLRNQAADLAI